MTQLSDLAIMKQLVEVKYRREQESFSKLMIQENRLRASLQQLDQQLTASHTSPEPSQRAIGADVLWQAWIGRKKRELNMQLAQILAVKELHVAQVRLAYGKVLVTDLLHDNTRRELKQKKAQSELDRAMSFMMF